MKTFLRILLGLFILAVIVVLIGLFLPSKIHVERSLTIKAPQKLLFEQVNNLHNWENWSPWHRIDTSMKLEYSGPLTGTGAVYSWSSENKNAGNGKLTILFSKPYDSISTKMDFMEQGTAKGYYLFQNTDGGTKVIWGFSSNMGKNPFYKYIGLFMKKYIRDDFEKGLKNLDSIATNLPQYVVEIINLKEYPYMSIKQKCNWDAVSAVMTNSYDKLMKYIQTAGAEMSGPPFVIYHKMEEGTIDIEMGIPTSKELMSKGTILTGTQNQSVAASTDYYGFYDNIGEAHGVVQDWIIKMELEPAGVPMEVYVSDPSSETDTTKWLTRIYYPVVLP